MVQLLEEQAINRRPVMNLFDAVTADEARVQGEESIVRRLANRLL